MRHHACSGSRSTHGQQASMTPSQHGCRAAGALVPSSVRRSIPCGDRDVIVRSSGSWVGLRAGLEADVASRPTVDVMTPGGDGFKVGDLSQSSGLTVRTLRYYDQIGLLRPSRRSGGGHRLSNAEDVRRLYRVCLLRGFGFALEEVAQALDDPGWDLNHALHRHLEDAPSPAGAHPTPLSSVRPVVVAPRLLHCAMPSAATSRSHLRRRRRRL
jgi:DNA-binding transcriptional MerR regulator